MMMRIRIIKKGYGHSVDQVLTVNEFEGGHLMAFGFAVPYIETKIETRPLAPPETRIEGGFIDPGSSAGMLKPHEETLIPKIGEINIGEFPTILKNGEQVITKPSFFNRRGRPRKK